MTINWLHHHDLLLVLFTTNNFLNKKIAADSIWNRIVWSQMSNDVSQKLLQTLQSYMDHPTAQTYLSNYYERVSSVLEIQLFKALTDTPWTD